MIVKGAWLYDPNLPELVKKGLGVLIMRFFPDKFKTIPRHEQPWHFWVPNLAPPRDVLNEFRDRKIKFHEFIAKYCMHMRKGTGPILLSYLAQASLDPMNKEVYVICCERLDTYCHRRILAEILNDIVATITTHNLTLFNYGGKEIVLEVLDSMIKKYSFTPIKMSNEEPIEEGAEEEMTTEGIQK